MKMIKKFLTIYQFAEIQYQERLAILKFVKRNGRLPQCNKK